MSLGRVAIFGPGLIGGSLALALKQNGRAQEIRIWARRAETCDALRQLGFANASQSLEETAQQVDLAVLCTPVDSIREIGGRLSHLLSPDAVVTDAGSTKQAIVSALTPLFGGRFVGSHPMAGSERSGLPAAHADLFQKAVALLTPTEKTSAKTIQTVQALWETIGCRVSRMDAASHDRLMARISHVPHVTAAALVNLVCDADPSAQQFAGGGYRDTTRVAAGLPDLWTEILRDNSREVSATLRRLIAELDTVSEALEKGDAKKLHAFLAKAKTARDLYAGSHAAYDV